MSVWTFNLLRPTNPTSTSSDVAKRTQMVIDAIIAEKPDLVALQEVVHSAAVPNRAKLIADATGYSWAYHQEYSAVVYEEGIGILSRWPILETEVVDLPHVDMFISTRRVLRARVGRPEGPIDFYCTHMIAFSLDDASADQALAAYQFITARKGGLPAMFAGDLNAEPSTLPMKFLRGETSYKNVTGNFVDSWLVTRANDPGYTSTSESPRNRIDYIYVVPSAQTSKPESCQLILDKPNDGTFASDHIGVACRILVH